MREIKFRAWNKKNKKMIDLRKITPLALDPTLNNKDGIYIPNEDSLIIEQYTGLKANGKEIYEGDILKGEYGELFPVVWFGAGFCLKCDSDYASLSRVMPEIFKVIGNIHENPELLEGSE